MSERLQVSQAVRGFPRKLPVRHVVVVALLATAVVAAAPEWWGHVVVSAARWPGRFWLVAVLLLAAVVLAAGGRRRKATAVGHRPRTPTTSLLAHVALLLAVAVAVAVVVGVLLWRLLGEPAISASPVGPAAPTASATWNVQQALEGVKIVLTVVGGVGAVVALTVAYRRQRLSEVAAYREDTKVLLDRFCAAAELLGSPEAAVRTAGVYAFAALANDAPEARQGCIDVLCAYLRQPYEPSPEAMGGDAGPPGRSERAQVTTEPMQGGRASAQDRQLRLTIIRLIRDNLHFPEDDLRSWRGHDFDFSGAVFDGGDFSGATFTGNGTVTFAGATITGPLMFTDATFAGGIVSFDGARFAGGSVCFSGARFTGGVVDLSTVDEDHWVPAARPWPVGVPVPAGLRLPADPADVASTGKAATRAGA
ncbi:pentapeptide repeat-containing protein [Micromonospora echinospora]|uniref:pentapeptide repeat-containing protein n=1 Tax=Micromonospora echinospora TaxID=1877 RepID=UPI0012FDCFCD|nr:pentapeptide repeat-containing protein [Micromonospora echinospora]